MPSAPRSVVPVASRSVFAGRSSMRVIDVYGGGVFKGQGDFTRDHFKDCPQLAELFAIDATYYLACFGGVPGLVKGASYAYGMTVFSENLKHMTVVGNERVAGGKIKFGHGSNEFKESRDDVWEFCVKRLPIRVIVEVSREMPVTFPLVLTREDTRCPVCMDDLSGNVVTCKARHQVCLACFNLLPKVGGVKKCPLCNVPGYTGDEMKKVEKMNGAEIEAEPYFYLDLTSGRNSYRDFAYNEALFLYALKTEAVNTDFDLFRRMLLSSFFNYCTDPARFVSSYTFATLHQVNGNERALNPFKDDLPQAFDDYLMALEDPEEFKKIYLDVSFTDFPPYGGYSESAFYEDLELLEGNIERVKDYTDNRKPILTREIYFRKKIHQSNRNELNGYFKNIMQRILNHATARRHIYNVEKKMMT